MSRDPFADIETPIENSGEAYTQGTGLVDATLVDRIVRDFISTESVVGLPSYQLDDTLHHELRRGPKVESQALLDGVIRKVETQAEQDAHRTHIDLLGSSLVQLLNSRDSGKFVLDYRQSPVQDTYYVIGGNIHTPRWNRLSVAYLLPDSISKPSSLYVGQRARNCDIEVYGDVSSVGYYAKNSSFRMDRVPPGMGYDARNCSFYLEGVHSVEVKRGRLLRIHDMLLRRRTGWYVDLEVKGPRGDRELTMPEGFFLRRNRLYVPDEGGDWQEVRP